MKETVVIERLPQPFEIIKQINSSDRVRFKILFSFSPEAI